MNRCAPEQSALIRVSGPEARNDIYRSVRLFPEGHSARMRPVSGKGKTLLLHSKLDVRFGARLQQAN